MPMDQLDQAAAASAAAAKRRFIAKRYGHCIADELKAPNAGRYSRNTPPVAGAIFGEIGRPAASDIDTALNATQLGANSGGRHLADRPRQ